MFFPFLFKPVWTDYITYNLWSKYTYRLKHVHDHPSGVILTGCLAAFLGRISSSFKLVGFPAQDFKWVHRDWGFRRPDPEA